MKTILTLLTLGSLLAAACGSGDTGGTPAPASTANAASACAKLVQYCPTGYSWSSYVTDEQGCRTAFECIYNLYTGSCRQTLAQGFQCLGALTSASGCSACDSTIGQLQSSCDYPASCLE